MNLPFEARIGLRYTRAGRRARRRNAFISFISAISMAGIALGVAALIVVLSVMNGFQKEVRDRMLSVLSHIEVFSYDSSLTDWRRIADEARKHPEVVAAAPYVSAQAMFTSGDVVRGALVRGIDPGLEPTVAEVVTNLKGGKLADLAPGGFGVILGVELAHSLLVVPGDKVTMIAPQGTVTPAGIVPRLRQFKVIATFESGHYEFDSTLAMIHIEDAERLFRVDGPTGVRLRIKDMQQAPRVAAQLSGMLDPGLVVRDWTRQNRTWFAAVQTEKRMMFIILTLIVAVAAFNLVSTLVMTVTEKQSDIAILRTLGASPASVMAVFIVQGTLIGVIGTVLGVGLGLLLANNLDVIVPAIEHVLGMQFLPKDVYFISELPSDPRASDIVPITVISLVLALVATVYPSWRAARVRPAEALRYD
ncbi:MAG TPA: lipoprotein-releasing ABC transporter permease subunit [Burkholderiaceae bacterium]|nr:lipoprotein-releasing ABC transporter permease subunit [Burkholderiaceae bacterium]